MYTCNYCRTEHEDNTRSVEHIIPRKILNQNYTLSNVCSSVNNLFSHAFEKHVVSSDPVTEMLLRLNPNSKKVFRGETLTPSGEQHDRWLQNGRQFFEDRPRFWTASTVAIPIVCRSGERLQFDLPLPFDITVRGNAASHLWRDPSKHDRRDRERVEEYLKLCVEDPSINPALKQFLDERDATFTFRSVELSEQALPSGSRELKDFTITMPIDQEYWLKFYMKIAWTHTCRQLGRASLDNEVANWIFSFLTQGYAQGNPRKELKELLGNPLKIGAESYYFWQHSPQETLNRIQRLPDGLLTICEPVARQRVDNIAIAQSLAPFDFGRIHDDAFKEEAQFRNHTLQFVAIDIGDRFDKAVPPKKATACKIDLFGRMFSGQVLIADRIIHTDGSQMRIDF